MGGAAIGRGGMPAPAGGRPDRIESLPIGRLDGDATFRLRPEGEVAGLARALARMGQLVPVDVRPCGAGFQLVTGFRRVAALRLLHRERVLARVHEGLADAAALTLALAEGLVRRPLLPREIDALRAGLQARGVYGSAAREAIEGALGETALLAEPARPDADVTSRDLAARLARASRDLAALYDDWDEVDPAVREQIRVHLRYGHDLLPFLDEREAAASSQE